ncbi:hypothetical protein [Polyangium sp. 15x6]|nr:hypothetical protein [Polyangium sp. 15x6]MDI3282099.1 hypothetical protein [Polyangium sp. 15x6]
MNAIEIFWMGVQSGVQITLLVVTWVLFQYGGPSGGDGSRLRLRIAA